MPANLQLEDEALHGPPGQDDHGLSSTEPESMEPGSILIAAYDLDVKTGNSSNRKATGPAQNEALLSQSANLEETPTQLSQPGVFQNNSSITSKGSRIEHSQEQLGAAAVLTSPSLVKGTKSLKRRTQMQPSIPSISNPPSRSIRFEKFPVGKLSLKQELPSTILKDSLNEKSGKQSEGNTNLNAPKFGPTAARTANAVQRDFFASAMLSGQALAAFFVIRKVDASSILRQAAALKIKTEFVASKDIDDPNVLIILRHPDHREENVLQAFLPIAVTASHDSELQSRGPSMLFAAAAAVFAGVVGAWIALAYV